MVSTARARATSPSSGGCLGGSTATTGALPRPSLLTIPPGRKALRHPGSNQAVKIGRDPCWAVATSQTLRRVDQVVCLYSSLLGREMQPSASCHKKKCSSVSRGCTTREQKRELVPRNAAGVVFPGRTVRSFSRTMRGRGETSSLRGYRAQSGTRVSSTATAGYRDLTLAEPRLIAPRAGKKTRGRTSRDAGAQARWCRSRATLRSAHIPHRPCTVWIRVIGVGSVT